MFRDYLKELNEAQQAAEKREANEAVADAMAWWRRENRKESKGNWKV